MNLFKKLVSKKYKGLKLNFEVCTEPIKSETIFNDNNYRASGSWYWKGDYSLCNKPDLIKGNDMHVYIRVQYDGSLKNRAKIAFHSMQSNISDSEIKFITKRDTNTHTYEIDIDNIMSKANTFIIDSTLERNGKLLTKNFIHFSSKDKNGRQYEGYLEFSDNAVDNNYKKYLLEQYEIAIRS